MIKICLVVLFLFCKNTVIAANGLGNAVQLVQHLPTYTPTPTLQYPNGSNVTLECNVPLTNDNSNDTVNGTIGIQMSPGNIWALVYQYGDIIPVDDTGKVPEHVTVSDVEFYQNSAFDWVKMTLSFHPMLKKFKSAKIVCGTDFNISSMTQEIKVLTLPSNPKLKIRWISTKGVVYAGDTLRARCVYFIGEIFPLNQIIGTWFINTTKSKYALEKTYGIPSKVLPTELQPFVSILYWPDVKKCPSNTIQTTRSRQCLFFSLKRVTWYDAIDSCKGEFSLLQHFDREILHVIIGSSQFTIGEEYWVGVNDRLRKGHYVWLNGAKANLTGIKEPTDKDEAYRRRCTMITTYGLETALCRKEKRVVCATARGYLEGHNGENVDREYGTFVETELALVGAPIMDNATVQCSSYKHNNQLSPDLLKGLTDVSGLSPVIGPLKLRYGQLKPTLTREENAVEKTVDYYCSAIVGKKDGKMSMTITHADFKIRVWTIGATKVRSFSPSPNVTVELVLGRNNPDPQLGDIKTHMKIHLTLEFHLATVTCYSYDYSNPSMKIVSPFAKVDLQASNLINLTSLYEIPSVDLEEEEKNKTSAKSKDANDNKISKDDDSILSSYFIPIFIVLFVAILIVMTAFKFVFNNEQKKASIQKFVPKESFTGSMNPPMGILRPKPAVKEDRPSQSTNASLAAQKYGGVMFEANKRHQWHKQNQMLMQLRVMNVAKQGGTGRNNTNVDTGEEEKITVDTTDNMGTVQSQPSITATKARSVVSSLFDD